MLPDNSSHSAPYSSWIDADRCRSIEMSKSMQRQAILKKFTSGAGLKINLSQLVVLLEDFMTLNVLELNNNWDIKGHLIELAPLKNLKVLVASTSITGHHGLHQFIHNALN